ncbi:MAG: S-layer homology domain-containing protein [Clostridiales Family XIII bacterium]|nr:S-layer homology domain-containing protein [Clostridiales Family XIII bacterium]
MFKRALSTILAFCLVFSMFALPASAAAPDRGKIAGNFAYVGAGQEARGTFYYDDAYFTEDSYTYSPQLATMSLILAWSAMSDSSGPYDAQIHNVSALLDSLGFTRFQANEWYFARPTADSIAAAAATKTIVDDGRPYTLIALAVRGGGYASEWASNFTVGSSGSHQGFNEAKEQVLDFLDDYVRSNGIRGNIKVWVTGYSRAAAVANLVAGALDSSGKVSSLKLDRSNLFAYTFETPAGEISSSIRNGAIYQNIFNIINPNDPVTKVAPSALGFGRYGYDKLLPTAENSASYASQKAKMLSMYNKLATSSPYTVDDFKMKALNFTLRLIPPSFNVSIVNDAKNRRSQSAFLDDMLTRLVKENIKTRANYVKNYQTGFREFFKLYYDVTDTQWSNFESRFESRLKSNIGILIISTSTLGRVILGRSTEALLKEYISKSLEEARIRSYDVGQMGRFAAAMAGTILQFAINHPNLTTTLIQNIEQMASAHFPELCLAWLQSMDPNYAGAAAGTSFSSGAYRIVRVNCPVDVNVYDGSTLVASIVDDVPQEVDGSSIVSALNENGEKVVYLPADADYTVDITAKEDSTMSYAVNEFTYDAGEITRVVNYYDVDISEAEEFTAELPELAGDAPDADGGFKILAASESDYSLSRDSGILLAADEDLSGSDATGAYYEVTVSTNNDLFGTADGNETLLSGNYASVVAVPHRGYGFEGWYVGNTLVSSEQEYRFPVQNDISLVARFYAVDPTYRLTISAGTGGKITQGESGEYVAGTSMIIVATPDPGYTLLDWTAPDADESILTSDELTFMMPEHDSTITANFIREGEAIPPASDSSQSGAGSGTGNAGSGNSGNSGNSSGSNSGASDSPGPSATTDPVLISAPISNGSALPFTDVSAEDWYYPAIGFVLERGITNGVTDTLYGPLRNVTRAQFITMLCRAYGIDAHTGDNFRDAGDTWYTGYLAAAKQLGISNGIGDNYFAPENEITREEMVVLLYNYAKSTGLADGAASGASLTYADSAYISSWASEGVLFATSSNWVSGKVGNVFDPQGRATRGELAQIFSNIFSN